MPPALSAFAMRQTRCESARTYLAPFGRLGRIRTALRLPVKAEIWPQNRRTQAEGCPGRVMARIDADRIEQAIQRALPTGEEIIRIGNEQVFKLAVELQKVLPKDTEISLRPIVERFYGLSNRRLVDEYGELLTLEDAYEQLLDAWPKVAYPAALQNAKGGAKRHIRPRPELAHLDRRRCYLATVCYEMQQIVGEDKDFYLSSYEAAGILGHNDHKKALRTLKRFCADGILQFVKSGNFKAREANEYKYIGHKTKRPNDIEANIEDQKRRLTEG